MKMPNCEFREIFVHLLRYRCYCAEIFRNISVMDIQSSPFIFSSTLLSWYFEIFSSNICLNELFQTSNEFVDFNLLVKLSQVIHHSLQPTWILERDLTMLYSKFRLLWDIWMHLHWDCSFLCEQYTTKYNKNRTASSDLVSTQTW